LQKIRLHSLDVARRALRDAASVATLALAVTAALASATPSPSLSPSALATESRAAASKPGLTCGLRMPAQVASAQPVPLSFSLHNASAHAVKVLVWATPLEQRAWLAPFVTVTYQGTALRYRGAMVKRGEPDAAAYVLLSPGQGRQAEVNLAQAFDLSRPGRYQVRPRIVLHDVMVGDAAPPRSRDLHRPQTLACQTLDFEVLG
jgi:hypothetical protein